MLLNQLKIIGQKSFVVSRFFLVGKTTTLILMQIIFNSNLI